MAPSWRLSGRTGRGTTVKQERNGDLASTRQEPQLGRDLDREFHARTEAGDGWSLQDPQSGPFHQVILTGSEELGFDQWGGSGLAQKTASRESYCGRARHC